MSARSILAIAATILATIILAWSISPAAFAQARRLDNFRDFRHDDLRAHHPMTRLACGSTGRLGQNRTEPWPNAQSSAMKTQACAIRAAGDCPVPDFDDVPTLRLLVGGRPDCGSVE